MALIGAMTVMTSCNSSSNDEYAGVEYIPVKMDKNDRWGFVNSKGEFLYEDEFENQPTMVVDGIFTVVENDSYTIYSADKKSPKVLGDCEGLVYVGAVKEGLLPITRPDSRISVIDTKGNQKFELLPVNGHEIIEAEICFSDGMLKIKDSEDKYGYVNTKGEAVITPSYSSAYDFKEGLALVYKDDKWRAINKKNETVFKLKDTWSLRTTEFKYGAIVVSNGDNYLFVDNKGESTKCPSKVVNIGEYNDKYYVFYDSDNYGVMSRKDNEIIVRAKYEAIVLLPGDKFLCRKDYNDYLILDSSGEEVSSIDDYRYVGYYSFIGLLGGDDHSIQQIDEKGKPVNKNDYYDMGHRLTGSWSVNTDYFDMSSINNIIGVVSGPDGYGNFIYGNSPKEMLSGSASDYSTYSNTASVDALSGSGYRYSYNTTAFFTKPLTEYHYEYYGYYYYNSSKVWTSGSKLQSLTTNFEVYKKLNRGDFDSILEELKSKGYTVDSTTFSDGDGDATLKNGAMTATIKFRTYSSSTDISVTFEKSRSYKEEPVEEAPAEEEAVAE